jgi:GTP-binding protein Era
MQELNLQDILSKTVDLKEKKVWYVAIVWRPNVGKSTFINALLWEKVSITSNIPQTTRKRVLAIYNDENSQIIFFDTPGIHQNEKSFNKEINKEALKSLREAEVVLYFVDSSRPYWEEEKEIEKILEFAQAPILTIYTKIDLKPQIEMNSWENIFKISSLEKYGFEEVIEKIKSFLPFWHPFYPEDYYTDQDIYFRISEIVREKVFLHTKEEVPHSIYVEVWEIEETPLTSPLLRGDWGESLMKIQAYIYTETDSQRYIIVWKNWSLITTIWTEARIDLEEIFWKKVFISLRVKTLEKWRKNEKIVRWILQ